MRTEFASLHLGERWLPTEPELLLGRVRHLPVVAEDGRLVGIVSSRDLIEASLWPTLAFPPALRRGTPRPVEVGQVMQRDVETIAQTTPIGVAAGRMLQCRVGCLPVVREDGVLLGLVSEADLLAAAYLSR